MQAKQDTAVLGQADDGKGLMKTVLEEAEGGVHWRDACVWMELVSECMLIRYRLETLLPLHFWDTGLMMVC